ncbi:MAG: NUDIX domain-containing protein [bacterium]|nr:NUDIX domain-containing protein [bacterium]
MKDYHKVIPAVYLLFIQDNKVLLQRRYKTGYEDGNYTLIGGHVDQGERATQAAVREAKEEIGVDIKEKDLDFYHLMHRLSGDEERFDIFFFAKSWSGEAKNLEPDKCDDLSWFPLDELPNNLIPAVKTGIQAYFDKLLYSEVNWKKS